MKKRIRQQRAYDRFGFDPAKINADPTYMPRKLTELEALKRALGASV